MNVFEITLTVNSRSQDRLTGSGNSRELALKQDRGLAYLRLMLGH